MSRENDFIEEVQDDDEMVETLSLLSDDGEEIHFEVIDEFKFKGKDYIILVPYEECDDEVVILNVVSSDNEDEEPEYLSIENEEVLYAVFDEFKNRNADSMDIE